MQQVPTHCSNRFCNPQFLSDKTVTNLDRATTFPRYQPLRPGCKFRSCKVVRQ